MGEIRLVDFGVGIDARRSASTSNPKSFRDIINCHITTGHTLKRRGGFRHVANLPFDTCGLTAHRGKLHIFRVDKGPARFGNDIDTISPALTTTPQMINGATTPIVIDDIERTHVSGGGVYTATSHAGTENINLADIRRVHFADSFNGALYVIVEHWNGQFTHHYLDGSPLGDRVPAWKHIIDIDNNWIKPSAGNINASGFVFKIIGAKQDQVDEPFWGLKDWASREADKWNTLQDEASADFDIKNNATVVDPYQDATYLAFHGGGQSLGVVYSPLDAIWSAAEATFNTQLPKMTLPVSQQLGTTAVFAENHAAQAAYINAREQMLARLRLLEGSAAGQGSTVKNKVAELKKAVAAAQTVYDKAYSDWKNRNRYNQIKLNAALRDAEARLAAAKKALNDYVSLNHADGNIDLNLDAVVALCKWKTYNYIAKIASTLATNAPSVASGDRVWLSYKEVTNVNGLLTIANDSLNDIQAIAVDSASVEYTQIKDSTLNQSNHIALNIASKLFVADGDIVRFCQTNDPLTWVYDANDTTLDTGWLGVGVHQSGSLEVTAIGRHLGRMVVFFSDSAQIWTVDPDPNLMSFYQVIEDVGTNHRHSVSNISNESVFLHRSGFRSIASMQYNNNLTDFDFGSPVDSLVSSYINTANLRSDTDITTLPSGTVDIRAINATPIVAKNIHGLGQYWCAIGSDVWVYTYSKLSKVSGWSRYTLPFEVDYIDELDGVVYIRSGDKLYAYDETLLNDDLDGAAQTTSPVIGRAVFQFLNGKSPSKMKMFHGFDAVIVGSANVSFQFDVRNTNIQTAGVPLTGDTNPGYLTPLQLSSTHIAPVIEGSSHFELEHIALYYNLLGRT